MEYPQEEKYILGLDGNAWWATGKGFENLQDSDNYAFGETPLDALHNLLMKEATQ